MNLKRDAILALSLAVLSLIWSAVAISHGTMLSRYDEWTYIDYARKVSTGHVPVGGEALSAETREDWACRGMEGKIRRTAVPSCERQADVEPEKWPFKAENYNAFHPPAYFVVAGYGGRAIAAVTGTDFVTAARWVSALFLAAGVVALFFAIRAWRASRTTAFAAALLALATPSIAASGAIVHNDAVTLLAGAAAVWLGARVFVHHKLGWLAPTAAAAGIALTRAISAAAFLTVVAVVALAAALPTFFGLEKADRRPLLAIVGGTLGATLLPYIAWSAWQGSRTPADYVPAISGLSTMTLRDGSLAAALSGITDAYGLTDPRTDFYWQPGLTAHPVYAWASVLYFFYFALPLVAVVVMWANARNRSLVAATVASPGVAGLIVQARELATSSAYFRTVSGRYAVGAAALHCASAALIFDRPRWRQAFAAFAGLGYCAVVVSPLLCTAAT